MSKAGDLPETLSCICGLEQRPNQWMRDVLKCRALRLEQCANKKGMLINQDGEAARKACAQEIRYNLT
jgi:hypothetical protein